MYTYFVEKTERIDTHYRNGNGEKVFETYTHYEFYTQKTKSKRKGAVEISKAILDACEDREFNNGCGDKVYSGMLNGIRVSWAKQDEILKPEYSNGAYRVTVGDYWDADKEYFLED